MIIYKATNKINRKSYIGQTIKTFERRKIQHLSASKNNSGIYFHRALNKYGIDNFDWDVVQKCNTKEELDKMEMYYIGYYDTYNNGYNLTLGGELGMYGYKHTEEAKKKMSKAHQIDLINQRFGRLLVLNKSGQENIGGVLWRCFCNPEFGGCGNITTVCSGNLKKGTTKSCGCLRKELSSKAKKGKTGEKHPRHKNFIITTPEGEELFISGLNEWCRNWKKIKLSQSCLSYVALGKHTHHKGYKCRYAS